jgi:hypothetical protein
MTDFAPLLRGIATRLPVSEPARSRILLEIATDVEDLFHHLTETGSDEDEAFAAVTEQFDLSDEALQELARIHSSPLSRSLDGLSGQARSPWERVVLGLVVLFVIPGLVGGLILQPRLFRDASVLVYGLVGLLILGLGVGVWKSAVLFGPAGNRTPVPRRGIRILPGLALLLFSLGFAGIWVELYRCALAIRANPVNPLRNLVEWLYMASATMVVALSGGLLVGLLWFFLENRAGHLEEKAAARILGPPA